MGVKFSKRHYETLAASIKYAVDDVPDMPETRIETIRKLVQHLCVPLSWDNPRFDRARFMKACGLVYENEKGESSGTCESN